MKSDDVADYLQGHPEFFEAHAQMLADIVIPHPYGGRTISLSERQLLTLRERVKDLEKKLSDLVELSRENEALQNKVHQYTLALFGARDLSSQQELAVRNLREIFAVPHAVIRLWQEQPPSSEVMAFADQHMQPVCAHHAVHDTQGWFGESGAHLRSFAYLPLHTGSGRQSIGMLILASEDARRFYPEMGTVFLQRIAETVSGALRTYL
jgi:uncharacterized protein YigA (DUF484 family)